MGRLSTREFELRLDDWAAGTLPDYQRGQMMEKAAESADCAELAQAAFLIVGAARTERLDLPGDAYFEDLAFRLEEELAKEAHFGGEAKVVPVRRAPIFSSAQLCASFIAAMVMGLWMTNTLNAIPQGMTAAAAESPTAEERGQIAAAPAEPFNYVEWQAAKHQKIAKILRETV